MEGFKQVSEEEFFATVGQKNVHPRIKTSWPYTSDWELPSGEIIGRSVQYVVSGYQAGLTDTKWFAKL